MKTTLTLSLFMAALVLSTNAFAYDEARDDGFQDPTISRLGINYNEKQLNDALKQRYFNYLRNKMRTNAVKNRKSQYYRHIASRAESNVTQRSTIVDRSGELKNVPYYQQRRSSSSLNTTVPNNPKRNFRVRAYDYYVEGGEAGEKALTEGVIDGQNHKVKRSFYNETGNANYADILTQIRAAQRSLESPDQVPTGYQSRTTKQGDWRRNLAHPYMFRTQ